MVAYFVSTPKKGKKGSAQKEAKKLEDALESISAVTSNNQPTVPVPSLHTPVFDITTPASTGVGTPAALPEFSPKLTKSADEVIHCVAVSQICFKMGRITVPPSLVFATQGHCLTPEQWGKVQDMEKRGEMQKFLSGGWRDVPESERWWNDVYTPLEPARRHNIAACDKLKTAMESAKSF